MEELVIILLQFVLKLVIEILCNLPFALAARRKNKGKARSSGGPLSLPMCLFIGAMLGIGSLYFFPNSMIKLPALRIANLFLAPITSAFISESIGSSGLHRENSFIQRHPFWQAFWFTIGMTMIRFFFTHTLVGPPAA